MYAPPTRSERGATALEYIGIIVIAALVVGAVTAGIISNGGKERIEQALCKAIATITQSGASCSSEPAKDPYVPDKCLVSSETTKQGGGISIAIVDIKNEGGLIIKKYSDGSATVTATEDLYGGVSTGIGAKAYGPNKGIGAEADAGAGAAIKAGSTWNVPADQADEFARKVQEWRNEAKVDAVLNTNPVTAFGNWVVDSVTEQPPAPPMPDEVELSLTTSGELSGSAGIPTIAGVDGKVKLDDGWKGKYNNKNGNITISREIKGSLSANGDLLNYTGGAGGSVTTIQSVTIDKDGNVVNFTETHTVDGYLKDGFNGNSDPKPKGPKDGHGGRPDENAKPPAGSDGGKKGPSPTIKIKDGEQAGQSVVFTNSLDLKPGTSDYENERNTVLAHVGLSNVGPGVGRIDSATQVDLRNPSDYDTPMRDLMQRKAQVTMSTFDTAEAAQEYGAEIKLGLKLGGNYKNSSSRTQATSTQYLSAPDADGRRTYRDNPNC